MAASPRSAARSVAATPRAKAAAPAKAATPENAAKPVKAGKPEKPEKIEKAPKTFTITELAQEFDITPRAIRFYEDVGLLTPARAGRNRVYTPGDRTRLKLTLRGKRLGLSLNEIRQLVHMYDSEADNRPQLEAFLAVLQDHRHQLEQQRDDIQVTLEEIEQHMERCRRLIAGLARPAAAPASPVRRAKASRA